MSDGYGFYTPSQNKRKVVAEISRVKTPLVAKLCFKPQPSNWLDSSAQTSDV